MKSIILFSLILFFGINIFSQDCKNFYYLQQNKTVEISIYNRTGNPTGKNLIHVLEVSTTGNETRSSVSTEFLDKSGKSINKTLNNLKCINGTFMLNMKIFLPAGKQGEQNTTAAKADEVYLEYPAEIKIGDKLKDGILNMELENNNGLNSSIEISITERNVEAKESITTAGGTWDCYKITSKNKLVNKTGVVGNPINSTVTEWYAPGFGVVKTESSLGKTEITSVN